LNSSSLGQARRDENPVVRLLQRHAVDALPGEAQRQGVVDAGTLEHLAHDVRGDTADVFIAGEVLAVSRHVVRREVLRQQIDLHRCLRMTQRGSEQQCRSGEGSDGLEHA